MDQSLVLDRVMDVDLTQDLDLIGSGSRSGYRSGTRCESRCGLRTDVDLTQDLDLDVDPDLLWMRMRIRI